MISIIFEIGPKRASARSSALVHRPANTEVHGAGELRQLDISSESDGNADESEASEGDSVSIEVLQREYVSKDDIIDAVAQPCAPSRCHRAANAGTRWSAQFSAAISLHNFRLPPLSVVHHGSAHIRARPIFQPRQEALQHCKISGEEHRATRIFFAARSEKYLARHNPEKSREDRHPCFLHELCECVQAAHARVLR